VGLLIDLEPRSYAKTGLSFIKTQRQPRTRRPEQESTDSLFVEPPAAQENQIPTGPLSSMLYTQWDTCTVDQQRRAADRTELLSSDCITGYDLPLLSLLLGERGNVPMLISEKSRAGVAGN